MDYNFLLESHLKYGTTKKDIIKRKEYEQILTNVVIAPWWGVDMFENIAIKIEKINDKLYNIYGDDFEFSFIQLKAIGAPVMLDQVLALGVTQCKNLLFIGSVGSLDEDINIGDIVIPKYSICGDGASRYLNKDLEDDFGKEFYPSDNYTKKLLNILDNTNEVNYHYVPNFSTDTIFAQFAHIDFMLSKGAKTIEMETAVLFKCKDILNINTTAMFCVSDNTVTKKSLYSGRTEEEREYRHKVRREIIPQIIKRLFKGSRI